MNSLIGIILLAVISGCAPKYDYTIHKPKVRYKKPGREALSRLLNENLGKKYVWAEEGPDAFDCSGLVYYCYGSMNMQTPRVAREQAKVGMEVNASDLRYGDLIFFDTTAGKTGQITHVGIYIGDGKFQHAANEREGVKITSLSDPYYKSRIRICRRYLPDDNASAVTSFKIAQTLPVANKSVKSSACSSVCYQVPQKITSTSGRYYIQLGSFMTSPNRAYLSHIRANGYDYILIRRDKSSKLLLGPFREKSTAYTALPTARKLFNPDAFITEI